MAKKRIQGITVEIGGDTTDLAKSLKSVDDNIKNTQSQLKDVEKLLKLDPANTELLSQKQKLLGEAVKDTKDRLDSLKTASEEAAKTKDNYDDWKAKITPIQTEITKTTDELNKLKKRSEEANEQLSKGEISQEEYDKIQRELKETEDKLKDLKKSKEKVDDEFGHPISPENFDALQREIIETEQGLQRLQNEANNSRTALVEIGTAGEGLQKVGGKISGVGQSLLPVTAGVAAVGAAGASSFAEVDKTMKLANKTMNSTAEEAEAVNDTMKNAAANSIFGMDDASKAMLNFARAGLKPQAAMSTLAPAMNLAAGEGGELETVSAGLVATMNSFHASFDEAGKYADVFAASCNNSALDVNSLCESMSVAGPIFSAAGYKVEDATLAMGLMGNSGIEAEVAATSLKTGISRLNKTTDEGTAALRSMGFGAGDTAEQEEKLIKAQNTLEEKTAAFTAKQTKYNEVLAKYGENSSQALTAQAALVKAQNDLEEAQSAVNILNKEAVNGTSAYSDLMIDEKGKMRPFIDVLQDLQGAFANLSESEQISAATAIFGRNQMTPWLALLNTAPEDVNELSEAINNSAGTTQEMADTMMSGFGGGIEKLKSSIDVLIYSIGEALAPTLQKVIDFVQGLVDKFNALSPAEKEMIVKIGLIAAAIGPLLIAVGKLTTGIGGMMIVFSKMPAIVTKIKDGFTAVKTALSGATGTMLWVVAIIGVLVAAFVNLWKNNEGFRNNILAIWEKIKSTFSNLTQGIVDRLNALGFEFEDITEVLKAVWQGLCDFVKPIFEGVFQEIADIFQLVTNVILDVFDIFTGIFTGDWDTTWNGIKNLFVDIWDFIKSTLENAMNMLCDIFGTDLETVKAFWTDVWNSICDFFVNTWNSFQENFQIGMDTIRTFWTDVWNAVSRFFTTIWMGIKNFFVGIWTSIYTTVSFKIQLVKNIIITVWNTIYGFISPLLEAFRYLFETIFEAIKILIGRAMDWISTKIQNIWNAVVGFITPILEGIRDFFTSIFVTVKNTVSNVMDSVSGKIHDIWNGIVEFITPVLEGIKNFLINIWNDIKTNISETMDTIKNIVSTVWDTIKSNISERMNIIKNTVSNVWENVKSAVSEKITDIKTTVTDGFNNAVDFVKGLADDAWNWGADIINGIVDGIKSKIQNVTDAVTGVADTIREYLHFSVPDKGPLTDFESWMPDFIGGLVKGINRNKKYIEKAVNSVAEAMKITLNSNLAYSFDGISGAVINGGTSGTVNNYYQTDNSRTVNQTNNSPKSLSRLEIYRQTKNALGV